MSYFMSGISNTRNANMVKSDFLRDTRHKVFLSKINILLKPTEGFRTNLLLLPLHSRNILTASSCLVHFEHN